MALIVSAASGNFNAGATWVGGIVPTVGDEARASNGHTITITANATCDEVSNAGTGIFTLASGVTLTANVTHKGLTNATNCLQFTAASPASGTIVGNITGGSAFFRTGAANTSSGTLVIQGNCFGGNDAPAVNNTSTGAVTITGNITGSTTATSANGPGVNNNAGGSVTITGNATGGLASGVNNAGGGSVTITGNVTGGTAANSAGVRNASTGSVTITGTSTGGSNATAAGIINVSTGTVTHNGSSVGGANLTAGPGAINSSTGTINITRAVGNGFGPGSTGLSAAVGASNTSTGVIEIQELEYGALGQSPTSGTAIRLKKVGSNVAIFNYVDSGSAKTLVDATQGEMPAESDVRSGVSYASGALTGTCAVPAAASVGFGVPVDNTTGTAALTPASIWDYALSSITASSTIGTLLKTNIDATISSRSTATTAGIADAVWDEVMSGHTINGTYGDRIVRSLNSNNTLQLTGSHHAAADVHQFQPDVITNDAIAASAITEIATGVRTELATELTAITELHLIHGLKSGSTLTVTPTSRSAGAVSQTISGDGTTTTTVSRD